MFPDCHPPPPFPVYFWFDSWRNCYEGWAGTLCWRRVEGCSYTYRQIFSSSVSSPWPGLWSVRWSPPSLTVWYLISKNLVFKFNFISSTRRTPRYGMEYCCAIMGLRSPYDDIQQHLIFNFYYYNKSCPQVWTSSWVRHLRCQRCGQTLETTETFSLYWR